MVPLPVAAVLTFNRHSQFMAACARRLFGVPCAAYFDDYDTCEPTFCGRTGKDALHYLHRRMGMPLAGGEKDVLPAQSNPFLGVITDFSQLVSQGIVFLRSKPSRIAKAVLDIERMLAVGTSPLQMERLCGKIEYTQTSASSGRCSRAALVVLREWAKGERAGGRHRSRPVSMDAAFALSFFAVILPLLRPRKLQVRGRLVRDTVIVYSDAMYDPNADVPARIGFVIYDPENPRPDDPTYAHEPWSFSDRVLTADEMALFAPRKQQVGQLEVLAGVAPYMSCPGQLRGRDVIHFIDNTGALFGLTKGYYGEVDGARLVHAFHATTAAIDSNVWFEWVASVANIADLPSRGEFDKLLEMGAVRVPCVIPSIGGDWEAVYRDVMSRLAPRATHGVKRQADAIRAAIGAERAKRARVA